MRLRDRESYYATLAHEITHWIGTKAASIATWAASALAMRAMRWKNLSWKSAAFLCADLGITPETKPDHAAYIASWLDKWRARHFSSNQQLIM
jgi:antirestriction protein ArdC